jgi:hypothetical protein
MWVGEVICDRHEAGNKAFSQHEYLMQVARAVQHVRGRVGNLGMNS